jgi:hypothetical protein
MPTPAAVAPNPDLALWIAGLGFLSSLVVVAINSYVTLRSKSKDIELKKQEQEYGFKMENFKRKIEAGESEIEKILLSIKLSETLTMFYSTKLPGAYSDSDTNNLRQASFNKLVTKHKTIDDAIIKPYLAYFSITPLYKATKETIVICTKLHSLILSIEKDMLGRLTQIKAEPNEDKKQELQKAVDSLKPDFEDAIRQYKECDDTLRKIGFQAINEIREEMKKGN